MSDDLTVPQGDTLVVTIPVTRDNVAVDLTGATARWVADGAFDITVTGGGIVIDDATGGILVATVAAATLGAVKAGSYKHECKVHEADGTISRVLKGTLTIEASIIGSSV